jgi:hypothetical protein
MFNPMYPGSRPVVTGGGNDEEGEEDMRLERYVGGESGRTQWNTDENAI